MTESKTMEKIRCDACPVMCYIADGKAGACDRYANHGGDLIRLDPLTIIQTGDQKLVPFLGDQGDQDTWDGDIIKGDRPFITAVGAGTTYPDYKPAPFIASQKIDGIDMVSRLVLCPRLNMGQRCWRLGGLNTLPGGPKKKVG